MGTSRKVLLCLRFGIGDLVMELPALEALRHAWPDARITALGARPATQLLEGDARIDRLVATQEFGFAHWADRGDDAIRHRFHDWLREEAFDLVIDPSHAVFGAAQAIWDRGGPILDVTPEMQRRAIALGGDGVTIIKRAVAEGWGIRVPVQQQPRLQLTADEHAFAARFLAARGAGTAWIGIATVASSGLKRWPLEHVAEVAAHWLSRAYRVLLFHGAERQDAERLLQQLGGGVVPVGLLHLKRIAALLARCRLLITNDTGLMHMAAAVGTSPIAIFGPTSERLYCPPGGLGIAPEEACEFRPTDRFGPPACAVEGTCFKGKRSCIDDVTPNTVLQQTIGRDRPPQAADTRTTP